MKRPYTTGIEDDAKLFIGYEVERTPAYGLKTLFVVGHQPVQQIENVFYGQECQHIFFGANHSYDPVKTQDWEQWESMIEYFLKKGILCTLDIPVSAVDEFHDGPLCEYNNFIPQIRVPIPYVKLWNYNTMIKIDDKGFNSTNPGVWCHSLHELMDRTKFTDWNQYNLDRKVE
jgi:hypothetical protein